MNFGLQPAEEKFLAATAVLTDDDCNALVKDIDKIPSQVCSVLVYDNVSTAGGKTYSKLSGYDVSAEGLELIGRNSFETQLLKIVSERLERLKKYRSVSFFLPSATLKDILFLLRTEFPNMFERVSCNLPESSSLSFGAESDFALISALLMFLCNRYGFGEVKADLSFREREIVFLARAGLKRGTKRSDILKNEERWLYFINLLAEANLWRFEADGDGSVLEFTLSMLIYDELSGFILRDDRDSRIISVLARLAALGISDNDE